jgi:hypothetical protein
MKECRDAAVIGMQRYRVVVVPLKTVSEVKSAGGVLRNRISADPPLPPGWITCCSGQRDSLAPAPRQPQQQHSTSTSTSTAPAPAPAPAAGYNGSRDAEVTLLPDIRSSTSTQKKDSTAPAPDSTSTGQHQRSTARARQRIGRCSRVQEYPKDAAPAAAPRAGHKGQRKTADDERAEALCPTKAENGATAAGFQNSYLTQTTAPRQQLKPSTTTTPAPRSPCTHGSTGHATTEHPDHPPAQHPRQHLDDDNRAPTAADAKRTRIVSVTVYLFFLVGTVYVFPL